MIAEMVLIAEMGGRRADVTIAEIMVMSAEIMVMIAEMMMIAEMGGRWAARCKSQHYSR